jgi:hypothetical protein
MARLIKMSTPKTQAGQLGKTAALTKARAEHKKWLKAHRIKVTRIHSAPDARSVIASAGILPSVI